MVFGVELDDHEKNRHRKNQVVSGRVATDPTEAADGMASMTGKCWYDEHVLYTMLFTAGIVGALVYAYSKKQCQKKMDGSLPVVPGSVPISKYR